MSWGNKILLVFIAFSGMISFMVYRCMRTPVDLVSDQYYKDELAYQQVIDGKNRANTLTGKVEMRQEADGISLQLPSEMKGRLVKGTIVFYCPSDAARDRNVPLSVDGSGKQTIAGGLVAAGLYTVKVSWETAGAKYFTEQPLTVH